MVVRRRLAGLLFSRGIQNAGWGISQLWYRIGALLGGETALLAHLMGLLLLWVVPSGLYADVLPSSREPATESSHASQDVLFLSENEDATGRSTGDPPPPLMVLYVDAEFGSPDNDGLTWATALSRVSDAILILASVQGPTEVHVAAGIYTDTKTLRVHPGVRLVGGYPPGGGERSTSLYQSELRMRPTSDPAGFLDKETTVELEGGGPELLVWLDGFLVTDGDTGIRTRGTGVRILNNEVRRNLQLHWVKRQSFLCDFGQGPEFKVFCSLTCSSQATGILIESTDTIVENNLVAENWSTEYSGPDQCSGDAVWPGFGCYLSEGGSWCPDGVETGQIHVDSESDALLRNNTVAGSLHMGTILDEPVSTSNLTLWNNIISELRLHTDNNEAQMQFNLFEESLVPLPPVGNQFAEPDFVWMLGLKYRLRQSSPAIDAGDPSSSDLCQPVSGTEDPTCYDALSVHADDLLDEGITDLGFHWFPAINPIGKFDGLKRIVPFGQCGLKLEWSPADWSPDAVGPFSYVIYGGDAWIDWSVYPFDQPLAVVPATQTSWVDMDLAYWTERTYVVRIRDGLGSEVPTMIGLFASPSDATPPNVTLRFPPQPPLQPCSFRVNIEASDSCSGLTENYLYRLQAPDDALRIEDAVASGPFIVLWDTVPTNGIYYYRVVVPDRAGNEFRSPPIEVRIDSCGGDPPVPRSRTFQMVGKSSSGIDFQLKAKVGDLEPLFRLYRGDLEDLRSGRYSHAASLGIDGIANTEDDIGVCQLEALSFSDPNGLQPGSYYYLVVEVDDQGREGSAGFDSAYRLRPAGGLGGTVLECP